MANKETKLKFLLELQGVDKLRGLQNNLIKLNNPLPSSASTQVL